MTDKLRSDQGAGSRIWVEKEKMAFEMKRTATVLIYLLRNAAVWRERWQAQRETPVMQPCLAFARFTAYR